MPSQLQLPNGQMHEVGTPVEDPAPEQAVEDAHAALAGGTAEEAAEPAIIECTTAFTVYIMEDGEILVGHDAWDGPEPSRQPTFDEITYGCAVLRWRVQSYDFGTPGGPEGCVTAFTPHYTTDGRWMISVKPDDPLVVERAPSDDEIVGGCSVVLRDVATQEILGPVFNQLAQGLVESITKSVTQSVIGNMINMGQQAGKAQEALKIAEKLEQDKQRRAGRG
jgi:hypothetical protein